MLDLLRKFLRQLKILSQQKWLKVTLRLVITLAMFYVLLKSFDWGTLFSSILHLDVGIILVGVLAGVCGIVLSCFQWKSLLFNEDIEIALPKLVNFYFIGIAFNHFLPSSVGGDVIKAYYVSRESGKTASSTSTVLMARITGMFGMFTVSLTAVAIWHAIVAPQILWPYLLLVVAACIAIAAAVFSVSWLPKIVPAKWAEHPVVTSVLKIGTALKVSISNPRSVRYATLFGILFHVETCLNYYIYAFALHLTVPFGFYLVAIPFVTLITLLPISINGFGVRESVFVFAFSTMHVVSPTALLLTFLVDLQTLFFGVVGGVIYLAMGNKRPAKSELEETRLALSQMETIRMPALVFAEKPQVHVALAQVGTVSSVNHVLSQEVSMNKRQFLSGTHKFPDSELRAQQEQRSPSGGIRMPAMSEQGPTSDGPPTARLASARPPMPQMPQGPVTPPRVPVPPPGMMSPGMMPPGMMPGGQIPSGPIPVGPGAYTPAPPAPIAPYPPTGKRKPNRGLAIGALCAILIVLATGGYVTWKRLQGPSVTVYQVGTKQTVNVTASGGGITYPNQSLNISYPLSEKALAVNVRIGDHVTPNQTLIKLDPTQSNQALTDAQNQVTVAQQYLASVQATGNATTIAQANENVAMAQNKYNALQAQNQNGNLVSPMNGVVTAVNINANETFSANTTLVTIVDQSSVTVYAKIPLANLGQVTVGSAAIVTPSAMSGVNFQGKVISVVPVADPQTDTFEALVQVSNPNQQLLPGLSAFVTIQNKVQGFVLPRIAVLNADQGTATVFEAVNGMAKIHPIRVIGRTSDQIIVDTGVTTGEPIITVGVDQLQDGQKINVSSVQQ